MLQLRQRAVSGSVRFDGRQTNGNRYYIYEGLCNSKLAGYYGIEKMLYIFDSTKIPFHITQKSYDPAYIISNSIPISYASIGTKTAIIKLIAYFEVGINLSIPIVLEELPGGEGHFGRTRIIGGFVEKIIIHPTSKLMKRSQYYDIYLNLVHEKHHADTPEDASTPESEYYAYKEVRFHHFFKYASDFYQEHVDKQLTKYENML